MTKTKRTAKSPTIRIKLPIRVSARDSKKPSLNINIAQTATIKAMAGKRTLVMLIILFAKIVNINITTNKKIFAVIDLRILLKLRYLIINTCTRVPQQTIIN